MDSIPRPQFEILNIVCLESEFKRHRQFDDAKEIKMNLNVGKSVTLDGEPMPGDERRTIVVDLTTTVVGEQEDGTQVYTCKVLTVGVFIESGEGSLEKEKFANMNAPAIMYAFQREYISNLSQKAGLNIFIPPLNFVQLHDTPKEK